MTAVRIDSFINPSRAFTPLYAFCCLAMFGSVRTHCNALSVPDALQITSWWTPTKPYDPTDPKQNPLNPQGLKPYAFFVPSIQYP